MSESNKKDVNIKDEKKAVALEYKETMGAPTVTAKGRGYVAQNMLDKAKEYGIETYIDEELLNSLMALSLGEEIPKELYDIVAKILVYVENVDKEISN